MLKQETLRDSAHSMAEYIFTVLFPRHGMKRRTEQVSLCHEMIDALFDNQIALHQAGVGIGKTYSYLVACILYHKFYLSEQYMELKRMDGKLQHMPKPVVISTSTIALQEAIEQEYIPTLSAILFAEGIIDKPLKSMIRKGKEHYICERNLTYRLRAVRHKDINSSRCRALRSLQRSTTTDGVAGLSGYDRRAVRVPGLCPRNCIRWRKCRYHCYLERAKAPDIVFQICNHNYLLADLMHRYQGMRPLLNEYGAIVLDEAHKFHEAARQSFTKSLTCEDVEELENLLGRNGLPHTAQKVRAAYNTAIEVLAENNGEQEKTPPAKKRDRALRSLRRLLQKTAGIYRKLIPGWVINRLEEKTQVLALYCRADSDNLRYIEYSEGNPSFFVSDPDYAEKLGNILWSMRIPCVLTSGTLQAGNSFGRIRSLLGLERFNRRIVEYKADSAFCYWKNCLLYLPVGLPELKKNSNKEIKMIAEQIREIVHRTNGHALVLFTSYKTMLRVAKIIKNNLRFPLVCSMTDQLTAIDTFRTHPNAVLFATGSCWEGIDFPGDIVSCLIIPRLPFPFPDVYREEEREHYHSGREYIKSTILPDMQMKLLQGFGRAIRTEADTCVVAILDPRASQGNRYHDATLAALPKCKITFDIDEVTQFIQEKKPPDYFKEVETDVQSDGKQGKNTVQSRLLCSETVPGTTEETADHNQETV